MISDKHLCDVCLVQYGNVNTCRYIDQDAADAKWYCLKHRKHDREIIDETIDEFLFECLKKGIVDPTSAPNAPPLGDNCSGYPICRHILQGYDCKP